MSAVRGVNVDGVMRTLLSRGLVEEVGSEHETGAILYATSAYFLERLGLRSLDELPELAPYLPSSTPSTSTPRTSRSEAMSDHDRDDEHEPKAVRLQKVMAAAGVGSRRACEVLIDQGRVEVDGRKVREQGLRVDPDTAVIKVDGLRITTSTTLTYLALNKPEGVISTLSDPEGRPCIGDYVFGRKERLFYVGRLDAETEGLLLLTNDGELAHRLTHPSYEVEKTYLAEIEAPVPRDIGRRLRAGVDLDDGPAYATSFRVVSSSANRAMVESRCTRPATTSSGGCSRPSTGRSPGWCARRWARSARPAEGRGRPRADPARGRRALRPRRPL